VNGQQLRDIRQQLGVTQVALAVALGLDVMTISRWERGVAFPSKTAEIAVRALLGCPDLRREYLG